MRGRSGGAIIGGVTGSICMGCELGLQGQGASTWVLPGRTCPPCQPKHLHSLNTLQGISRVPSGLQQKLLSEARCTVFRCRQ